VLGGNLAEAGNAGSGAAEPCCADRPRGLDGRVGRAGAKLGELDALRARVLVLRGSAPRSRYACSRLRLVARSAMAERAQRLREVEVPLTGPAGMSLDDQETAVAQ
jgi:hypothetical protein